MKVRCNMWLTMVLLSRDKIILNMFCFQGSFLKMIKSMPSAQKYALCAAATFKNICLTTIAYIAKIEKPFIYNSTAS